MNNNNPKLEVFFSHPHTLFDRVGKVLEKVGPEKFFSSPDEEVKQAREGFAAYFFTLALKEYTKQDWWLAQYDQAAREYPDFDFMTFPADPSGIRVEPVELTGVYPHFKDFKQVTTVVDKKLKQYREKQLNFSLLIFVNHEKSEEWIRMLREYMKSHRPFLSVWTIHLRFKEGGKEVGKAVAQRIRPLPGLRIEADTDNPEIHKRQPLPAYMEESSETGNVQVRFKQEFVSRFGKKAD